MIQTAAVCGAGTMGRGIAQVIAQAGIPVILFDLNESILQQASESLQEQWGKMLAKGKITAEEKKKFEENIRYTTNINDVVADICIEAIIEQLDPKQQLFQQLTSINSEHCVLASNTSSLSITSLADTINNPQRIAGLHFFNPAALMKLVEIVKGNNTDEEVMQILTDFVRRLGKTPVRCIDSPGFIVNRVARPYYIEALRLVEEGLASFEEVDRVMENAGFKLGPFKLMDLIGNDVNYAASQSVYQQLNEPLRLKPSFIQEEKVKQGSLGKKTGKGYYDYSS